MTAREKLAMEHPDRVNPNVTGGSIGCPFMYGYLDAPDYCDNITTSKDERCTKCWDREIPEEMIGQDIDGEPHILDSGDRTEFESGAVRDMRKGKGRCDLLPLDVVSIFMQYNTILNELEMFQTYGDVNCLYRCLDTFSGHWDDGKTKAREEDIYMQRRCTMLLEVAKHFEDGAVKYGDNNWRKGIPVKFYIDSAIRHYLKFLRGDKDEPHDRAVCWNLMCAIWTCKHHPELNEYAKEETHEKED